MFALAKALTLAYTLLRSAIICVGAACMVVLLRTWHDDMYRADRRRRRLCLECSLGRRESCTAVPGDRCYCCDRAYTWCGTGIFLHVW